MGQNESIPYEDRIKSVTKQEALQFFDVSKRLEHDREWNVLYTCFVLGQYTILNSNDPLKQELQDIFINKTNNTDLDINEKRGLACFMGMVIGDALGAPLEFSDVCYNKTFIKSFDDIDMWKKPYNAFKLKVGQWTDDASMGLCLAESLLSYPNFNPSDLRTRFINWWDFGYRNAFGYDPHFHSVGLGGCISMSFRDFKENQSEYTSAGDKQTSGNGSLMRLAAVPIFYHNDMETALSIARKQSLTTHQGEEAAECCRLMTFIIISYIHSSNDMDIQERKDYVFECVKKDFKTDCYSVQCLALSEDEKEHPSNKELNLNDRKWNWKQDNYKYCESRAIQQPRYIGSYAMDGLAMALHCVWTTNTFKDALLKAINLRGDSDTVGSITGQIAGSLYGIDNIPTDWIIPIQKWDNSGEILLTAAKLYRNEIIPVND